MKLISDWRRAHHYISVQSMVIAGAVQGAWLAIPDDLRNSLPHWVPQAVTGVLLGAGIVGRLIDQAPQAAPTPTVPAPRP